MFNYFAFEEQEPFLGTLSDFTNGVTSTNLSGSIGQPGDRLKIINDQLLLNFDQQLTIASLDANDWTVVIDGIELRKKWLQEWLKWLGIDELFFDTEIDAMLESLETQGILEHLSGPVIAWHEQNPETLEISLGVGVQHIDFMEQFLETHFDKRAKFYKNKIDLSSFWASPVLKITYLNHTDYCWTFDSFTSNYEGDGVEDNLETGAGKTYGVIKLAGLEQNAHYRVVKDPDPNDPTQGIVSGIETNFCVGEILHVIDMSTYTTRNVDFEGHWTWYGGNQEFGQEWDIADVTNPGRDYNNVPIFDQVFPIRVLSDVKFEQFQPRYIEDATGLLVEKLNDTDVRISWHKSDTASRSIVLLSDNEIEYPIDFEELTLGDIIEGTEVIYLGGRVSYIQKGLHPGTYQVGVWMVNAQYEYSNGIIRTFTL